MAYMDEQAIEREKTRQKLLAGKQPLLGDDTMSALQSMGVNLAPSSTLAPRGGAGDWQEMLRSLILTPKGVTQTPTQELKVDPHGGGRVSTAPSGGGGGGGVDLGGILTGLLGDRKNLRNMVQQPPPSAKLPDMVRRGRTITAPQAPVPVPPSVGPAPTAAASGPDSPAPGPAPMPTGPGTVGPPPGPAATGPDSPAPGPSPPPGAAPAATGAAATMAAGRDFGRVNQQFMTAAQEYAKQYAAAHPDKSVTFTSGYRAGAGESEHGRGNAFDMQLIDKASGQPLQNYRPNDPKTFSEYQQFANGFHQYLQANHPDLAALHRWGGYFSGDKSVYGSNDVMHHDLGMPRHGMLGGDWENGLYPNQAKIFGLQAGGGLKGQPTPTATAAPAVGTAASSTQASATGGLSQQLLEHTRHWEAGNQPNLKAYPDGKQYSIGYGSKASSPNETITPQEAESRMRGELTQAQAQVDKILPPGAPQGVRDALTSLTHNVGPGWMTEQGGRLAAAVKAGDYTTASQVIKEYNHITDAAGNKTVSEGLTNRRADESKMILGGQQAGATAAPAAPAAPPVVAAAPAAPPAAAPTPQPPPAAAAPAPPKVAAAPAPAAPAPQLAPTRPAAPTGVAAAHQMLDTKVTDLVKKFAPDQVSRIPSFIGDKTLRQAMDMPLVGGQIRSAITPHLGRVGVTPEQFNEAVTHPPAPQKTSDLGTSGATDFSARSRVVGGAPSNQSIQPGKPILDPASQPAVQDKEGNISTVRTIGIRDGGKEVNIPTVSPDGRIMTDQEAIDQYRKTGVHLGSYSTEQEATAAAQALHENEAKQISQAPQGVQAPPPGIVQALENAVKDEARVPSLQPQPDAQPVAPVAPGGGGPQLPLAPAGLQAGNTGPAVPAVAPEMPAPAMTQGAPIAMMGVGDTGPSAAASPFQGVQPPVPWEEMQGWGWGGEGG